MKLRISADEKGYGFDIAYSDASSWSGLGDIKDDTVFNRIINDQIKCQDYRLMPPAVRYISPDRSVIVWEDAPGYVTFNYTDTQQGNIVDSADSSFKFRLPVPWQRYVIKLSADKKIVNIFLFFANHQIESLTDDPLYMAPILNFYSECRLCPAAYSNAPSYGSSILDILNHVYNTIWNSGFNIDTYQTLYLTNRLSPDNLYADENTLIRILKKYYGNSRFDQFYHSWSNLPLDMVVKQNYALAFRSIDNLLASGHLNHNYLGAQNDYLVQLVLAAQDAIR